VFPTDFEFRSHLCRLRRILHSHELLLWVGAGWSATRRGGSDGRCNRYPRSVSGILLASFVKIITTTTNIVPIRVFDELAFTFLPTTQCHLVGSLWTIPPKRAVSTVVVDDGKTSIHLKRKESRLHLIMDYACFVSILGSKEVKTTGRKPACRECGNKIDAHYCNSGPSNTTTALLLVSDHLTESR